MSGDFLDTNEFRVNITAANDQRTNPNPSSQPYSPRAIATDPSGRYVVTWSSIGQDGSGFGIYANLYDSDGSVLQSEILVNTVTTDDQIQSAVAMDNDGDFVITWVSYENYATEGANIYAQRFDNTGVAQGGVITVSNQSGNDLQPSIAIDQNGEFIISYTRLGRGYVRRYNADGTPRGAETTVDELNTTGSQKFTSIGADANANFVVAWSSPDGSADGIYIQRFNDFGGRLGGVTQVNTITTGDQDNPSIAVAADGSFIVAWAGQDFGGYGIYARRYDSSGNPIDAEEFLVNQFTLNEQHYPTVAYERDGDSFVISWTSINQPGGSASPPSTEVVIQRFNEDATFQGTELLVNTYTPGNQQYATVAIDNEGDFVTAWSTQYPGEGWNVSARRYGRPDPTAPTDIDLSANIITENEPANTVIGLLSATDDAALPANPFTLIDDAFDLDSELFNINGNELRLTGVADADTQASYRVKVRVTDASGFFYDEVFEIQVLDVIDEPPTAILLDNNEVNENIAADSLVGTLSAEDADVSDTFTFVLVAGAGDDDNGAFTITDDQLTINNIPDFEAQSSYSIRVQVTDSASNSIEEVLTINVVDLFDVAPTAISLTNDTLNEGSTNPTAVGTLQATDIEVGDSATFALVAGTGDTNNGLFTINASNQLVFTGTTPPNFDAPDNQTTFSVRVEATDLGNNTFEQALTINVTDLFDESPTDIQLAPSTLEENEAAGTIVGDLDATDADAGDSFTFTLVAGTGDADNGSFTINASNQLVYNGATLTDFETQEFYNVRVRVTDQGSNFFEEELTVTVNDNPFDNAPTAIALTPNTFDENSPTNTPVGTLSATDPDTGDSFTYALIAGAGDTDNALFDIAGDQLEFIGTTPPDFEAGTTTYSIRVEVTDAGNNTFEQALTIDVNDLIDEAPTNLQLSANTLDENSPTNTVVGTFTADDLDAGDVLSFTLVAGAGDTDNGSFTINASNELVFTGTPPNFDAPDNQTSFSIRVQVADSATTPNTLEEVLTINVNDLFDESPTDIQLAPTSLDENEPAGTIVGDLAATDADAGDSFTFTLVAGTGDADNGSFTINASNQLVYNGATLTDFETQEFYNVRVRVTDQGSNFFEEELTVTVNDNPFDNAPTAIALTPNTFDENSPTNTPVGTLSATDPDTGDSFTYALIAGAGDTDNALFDIAGDQLEFIGTTPPDFEAGTTTYSIRVEVTDAGNNTFEQALTIDVNDLIDEAPTNLQLSANTLDENSPTNTVVGTFTADDLDAGDVLSFTLVAGAGDTDNGSFTINASNELVFTGTPPNFDAPDNQTSFSIRVQVADSAATPNTLEEVLTINVNDLFDESPTDIQLAPSTLDENEAAGTIVGDLDATDADAGDSFTFTLVAGTGDADNGSFIINASNQLVYNGATPTDAETQSTYNIRIRVTDQGSNTFDEILTVSVVDNPFDNAPTAIALTPNTFDENSPTNTPVGTLSATDPDTGDSFTYALIAGAGDTDNALFDIAGDQLEFIGTTPPDFEAGTTSYSVRVEVTDAGNNTFEQALTINVNDLIDEAPTNLQLSANTLDENSVANTVVGTLSADDDDAGDTLSFSLIAGTGDTDNGSFTINASNELVFTGTPPNFDAPDNQTSFSVRVQVADSAATPNTLEEVLTINVNDLFDESPTNLQLSANTLDENVNNVVVGDLTADDADASDTLTFTLVSGTGDTDNGSFTINASNELVYSGAAPTDFETQNSYSIRVRATDQGNNTVETDFTITVTDSLFDGLPTAIALAPNSLDENSGANTTVGTLSTTDPDAGDSFAYTLVAGTGDTDNGSFSIAGDQLTLIPDPDFEAQSSYQIRVQTQDQAGNTFAQVLTVSVNNLPEAAPTSINLSTPSIDENIGGNTVIGTLSATDPEPGDTFTYDLVAGAGDDDNGSFSITGDQLTLIPNPDFETQESYSIRVRVTDSGGNQFIQVLNLAVNNVFDEAPTAINLDNTTIDENSPANSLIGTLSADDLDVGDSFTFTLINGAGDADNNSFTITGDQLTLDVSPDFETQNSYSIRVQVTDGGGNVFAQALTINVGNLPELNPPTQLNLSANRIDENVAPGTPIGVLSAVDPDDTTGFVFSKVDAPGFDNTAFTVVGNELRIAISPDYETKSLYRVRLRVADPGGGVLDRDFTISINDRPENRRPTDIILTSTAIAEESAVGSNVGTLVTTDPDIGDSFTYTLVDEPGLDTASFTIDGASLNIAEVPDFETQSSYRIKIRTTDSGGLSREEFFTITVLNRQENTPPANLTLSSSSVAENVPVGTVVGTLSAEDSDPGESLTFELVAGTGDTDNASFRIQDNQLQLLVSPDFEGQNTYSVRVRVTDQQGNELEESFAIAILDRPDTGPSAVAPILDINGGEDGIDFSSDFIPGTPVNVIGNNATITDSDSANLVSAVVVIANPLNTPSEILAADTSGTNILATYNTTGVLTLTGVASLNDYLQVLQTVTYNNTVSVPGDEPRSLVTTLDDGFNTSPGAITELFPVGNTREVFGTEIDDPSLETTPATDLISALAGDDIVSSSFANLQQDDRIDGGTGLDTLRVRGGTGNVTIDATGTNQVSGIDPETLIVNFEYFSFSSFEGTLTMRGRNGFNDSLTGGLGNDSLYGFGGADTLIGNTGDDLLDGGDGNDRLFGGLGNDSYVVSDRNDRIFEEAGEGRDTIFATVNYVISENVENLYVQGDTLRGTGNDAGNWIIGSARRNQLNGRRGRDTLLGGDGNDLLIGGGNNDFLNGQTGRDQYNGGLGRDTFVLSPIDGSNRDFVEDFQGIDTLAISLQELLQVTPSGVASNLSVGRIQARQFQLGRVPTSADHRFIYDQNTGAFYFDADGVGTAARRIPLAEIQNRASIRAADIRILA